MSDHPQESPIYCEIHLLGCKYGAPHPDVHRVSSGGATPNNVKDVFTGTSEEAEISPGIYEWVPKPRLDKAEEELGRLKKFGIADLCLQRDSARLELSRVRVSLEEAQAKITAATECLRNAPVWIVAFQAHRMIKVETRDEALAILEGEK